MVAPKEGLYNQKRGASVDVEPRCGPDDEEEKDGRLQTEVDPLADVAPMGAVELIGGVGMEQGKN